MFNDNDKMHMKIALWNALKAYQIGEVPVGAVLVNDVTGKSYSSFNTRETDNNVFSHAESKLIDQVCKELNTWNLVDFTMYTTLEPCAMCFGAILQSRIKRLVISSDSKKYGATKLISNDPQFSLLKIETGLLANEATALLKNFFKKKR